MGDAAPLDMQFMPPTILIVEDEWLVREEIAEEFRREGWTVLESSTGEGAVGLLESGEAIDALITDIQLAGRMSGWDVAEEFRARCPDIPIVYTSGTSVQDARVVAKSTFVSKPCQAHQLMDACRKCATAH